ncbi:Uu.00g089420.m01.CDS01 [Anthostomella pinea]|uniref:Uu.00g089420.m01.CDS01 n=1 Tax=Anthostomella pinea TaxID=933095 RepID=A0AAI8YK24_9PEZI|nr:Uu.00g089420.m01.CDS01 [Anthostomella pinea]
MESVSTARISGNMIANYVGQNVMVVGKVTQLRGETATIDANGQVHALLSRDSHLMAGNGAQIIGKVLPDLSIKVLQAMDLGNNVGMYNKGGVTASAIQLNTPLSLPE